MNSGPVGCGCKAFTIVELLVSVALISIVLVVLASITNSTQRTWTYTTANVEQFRDAREAFETMTRKLSQATLNTYWDYNYPNGTSQPPSSYMRQSDLRFVSGTASALTSGSAGPTQAVFFQAPLGYAINSTYSNMDHLLNTMGYFIQFGSDSQLRPPFLPSTIPLRYRFRLMELEEPSDSLTLYQYTSGIGRYQANIPNNSLYLSSSPPAGLTGYEWFTTPLDSGAGAPVRPVGENIVALILLPKFSEADEKNMMAAGTIPNALLGTSLAPNYSYDSTAGNANANLDTKNQLPPVIQVTMVAVDETSFKRALGAGTSMPDLGLGNLFQTAASYQADLDQLQANLLHRSYTDSGTGKSYTPSSTLTLSLPVNYRIFSSNVSIEGSKWSRAQVN